ncbi:class I SAM-dependent methyltransferase [Calycomorphotria hydatis]|uniref:Bifunctional 3-demethylubiquinone-9 3-methyltransferase/ 2-octaprenyl-6-hydroxy phenol methylase n=1 Tax=Calycomorphotria hydatis TaxID=2528027 RepID=A0A517T4L6_9PLAN|nr:class I SAM-dependent methyltransferase [Calycomorphotria hydatis]QDT63291.1 bifunctional 3-demethylubiquinone-9 3-methyltransferase/ 2-octaprenyl-6-hydroxy phenol methylase [Calycomorphotria hydatis]
MTTENRLVTRDYWKDFFWDKKEQKLPDIRLDDSNVEFQVLHDRLQRYLPRHNDWRFLEIGCCPGRYLYYFHHTYGYQVTGIEYVEDAAEQTRLALQETETPARVITADLFEYAAPENERYDVVLSVGFVEHFHDISEPIKKHWELLAPDGLLVIWVPNHQGLCGWLLKRLQPDVFAAHNCMGWKELKSCLDTLPDIEILTGGYWGKFNLAPANFMPWLETKIPYLMYRLIGKFHSALLRCRWMMPETHAVSPYVGVIAKKKS